MRLVIVAAAGIVAGCLLALAYSASAGPMMLNDHFGLVVGVCLGAGAVVVAVGIMLAVVWAAPDHAKPRARRYVYVASAVVVLTAVASVLGVPTRIAFAWSRSEFDELARRLASPTTVRSRMALRAGIYQVDEYAVDTQGGMYFRVGSSSLLETTSWGFCTRPHSKTSPFGAARYGTWPIGGGWYWFEANDDWY